jgi:uncharacterized protein
VFFFHLFLFVVCCLLRWFLLCVTGHRRREQIVFILVLLSITMTPVERSSACCNGGDRSSNSSSGSGSSNNDDHTSWFSAIAAGLLSSSCCAIQLFLNLLSSLNLMHVGCAGFNKVLGPVRPVLRGISLLVMAKLWYDEANKPSSININSNSAEYEQVEGVKQLPLDPQLTSTSISSSKKSKSRLILQTCLCLTLMFLPEALRAVSTIDAFSRQTLSAQQGSSGFGLAMPSFFSSTIPIVAPSLSGAVWKHYKVQNMGCEACASHVQSVVKSKHGVIDVNDLVYEEGILSILVQLDGGFDEEKLKNQLFLDGYELEDRCSSGSSGECSSRGAEVWSGGRVSTIRLLPGMDLKLELQNFVKRHHIRAGSVISCVGSLERVVLRLATRKDGHSMKVLEIDNGFFEITSLSGTVAYDAGGKEGADGTEEGQEKPADTDTDTDIDIETITDTDRTSTGVFHLHLHMTLCDEEGQCVGGHVLPGNIIFTTAEITILDSSEVQFTRQMDSVTGFKELVVQPRLVT